MAVEFKDYYRVLGVTPKATDDEIKKAFRTLTRKYHPDVAKDKKSAEDKFKEINEANEVLSNPESRRKFDQLGSDWKTGAQSRPTPSHGGARSAGHNARRRKLVPIRGHGIQRFF
jgi:curved DNA-binding protein